MLQPHYDTSCSLWTIGRLKRSWTTWTTGLVPSISFCRCTAGLLPLAPDEGHRPCTNTSRESEDLFPPSDP